MISRPSGSTSGAESESESESGTKPEVDSATRSSASDLRVMAWLAAASSCLYAVVAFLSWRFRDEVSGTDRPIILVLLLFTAAFGLYLYATVVASRAQQNRRLALVIIGGAIVFRVVLLFSVPIQEIDIYRYLWDGAVTHQGISPFRYSPDQVREAASGESPDARLRRLVELQERQPAFAEILSRVHFGDLPTIYPPTSQAVFLLATASTPANSHLMTHVFIMKAWLIGLDLATLFVVIGMLRACQMPLGLSVVYGWCPLLIKEVANSGHLDAIAVFLSALAFFLIGCLPEWTRQSEPVSGRASVRTTLGATLCAALLALSVGAKLYPIVLAPLFLGWIIRRLGWRYSLLPTIVFTAVVAAVVWPMIPRTPPPPDETFAVSTETPEPDRLPISYRSDPSEGITTFLKHWEMNDFIFLILIENLKQHDADASMPTPWFSVLPENVRSWTIHCAANFGVMADEAPFVVARALTGGLFVVLAVVFAWRGTRRNTAAALYESAFLTLAWFWLLCPTQNPWYWTWVLPFLPFARSRVWFAMAGLVMIYYLRFWFSYHWPNQDVLQTGYVGHVFFDLVVTWIEFAPWFICLALFARLRHRPPKWLWLPAAVSEGSRV